MPFSACLWNMEITLSNGYFVIFPEMLLYLPTIRKTIYHTQRELYESFLQNALLKHSNSWRILFALGKKVQKGCVKPIGVVLMPIKAVIMPRFTIHSGGICKRSCCHALILIEYLGIQWNWTKCCKETHGCRVLIFILASEWVLWKPSFLLLSIMRNG